MIDYWGFIQVLNYTQFYVTFAHNVVNAFAA
jgi:hypothetical protein